MTKQARDASLLRQACRMVPATESGFGDDMAAIKKRLQPLAIR
jgi:hypothetical protein